MNNIKKLKELSWSDEAKLVSLNLEQVLQHFTNKGLSIDDIMIIVEDVLINDIKNKNEAV